ncbi:MAG: hypothetical protein UV73_C0013G0034 [Candidatus Gottesmanbacteria bacterium GW2011_GWA2_43_14]|uniref:Cohesin domain-containing protein n=1 Tax=Candidatus Gottesmanbacteria bacterium GW2011_GWA2_43_14 TaxID=1618443 RepID=A0A0G1DE38_9BACT|nr:MAG: hypothetical protein UV73_C0013G0034 [Candidatus Gottesmanbacteria bacterium GW2011_GWA2_43_14]
MQAKIDKKQLNSLLLLLGLVLFLPLVVFFLGRRFDIRPKASLAGKAHFRLNSQSLNVSSGDDVNVLVSLEISDPQVRVSAVSFPLLYDASKLRLKSVAPNLGTVFTEAPWLDDTGSVYPGAESQYNFVGMALVSNKSSNELSGGTVTLANVTFEALADGDAVIKFPDNNSEMQVVGTEL